METTYKGYIGTNSSIDIFNGDLIILQHKTPQIGDVILFRPLNSSTFYFHRIVAETVLYNQTYFLTKGDNNRYSDISTIGDTNFGWIPASNVVGVAVYTIHGVGWFLDQITTLDFIISFFGLILLAVIMYLTLQKEIRQKLRLKNKNSKLKFIKFKNNNIALSSQNINKIFVIFLILLLIFSFVGIELTNALLNPVSIHLLQTNDTSLPNYIDFTNVHLFDLEQLQINGQWVYFLNIKLQLTSGGFFNSLDNIHLYTQAGNGSNGSNTNLFYSWKTTSYFSGSETINGALVMSASLLPFFQNTTITIQIMYSVSHFFYVDSYSSIQSLIIHN